MFQFKYIKIVSVAQKYTFIEYSLVNVGVQQIHPEEEKKNNSKYRALWDWMWLCDYSCSSPRLCLVQIILIHVLDQTKVKCSDFG